MRSIVKSAVVVAVLGLLAQPLAAADGLLIVEKSTVNGTTNTNQVQIEKTRMRAEAVGPNGGTQVFIFDSTAQVIRIIDTNKKTYTEMTKADADRMGTQMAGAMAQVQEQLKNLPPAQRAQMQAMMRGRGMGAAGAVVKTEYRRNGTDKVGKWTCDKYDGYQGDKKTSEVCTVDPSTLGFTAADFAVTEQIREFFQKMMPQNADQIFSFGGSDAQGYHGVPVRRVATIGTSQTTSELTDVSRQSFPESMFVVPPGFTKQAFGPPGR